MDFPKPYARAALRFAGIVGLALLVLLALSCSKASAQVITYGPPATAQKGLVRQKTHWFPGGLCYIERFVRLPEMVTFATTTPEHLRIENIKSCIAEAKKLRWQDVGTFVPVPTYDSLREARTSGMACMIASTLNTPQVYQVRFSALILTGKDAELRECMARAGDSSDKAKYPPQPTYPQPIQPSGSPIQPV